MLELDGKPDVQLEVPHLLGRTDMRLGIRRAPSRRPVQNAFVQLLVLFLATVNLEVQIPLPVILDGNGNDVIWPSDKICRMPRHTVDFRVPRRLELQCAKPEGVVHVREVLGGEKV